MLLSCAAAAQVPPLATHDPTCAGHEGPRALVRVAGFKDYAGQLRVELYPATAEDFLAPGRKLVADGKIFRRIDVPTPVGPAEICLPLPELGSYAIAVLHDRDADGRLNPFSDGFGFPNNPRLGYKKPKVESVTIEAAADETLIPVILNYWNGFSARPLAASSDY